MVTTKMSHCRQTICTFYPLGGDLFELTKNRTTQWLTRNQVSTSKIYVICDVPT